MALLGILAAVVLLMGIQAKPAYAAECTDSLQAKIDAAPSGGTVTAKPCVYRQHVNIKKPIILKASTDSSGNRSEIRGSDVWPASNFTKLSNGTWRSAKTVPSFPQEDKDLTPPVSCQLNTKRCLWPEQVFLDGKPLTQVDPSATPKAGQFKVDSTRHIVLGESPATRTVEVAMRRHWLTSELPSADGTGPNTDGASNVTVEGFIMKHAATEHRGAGLMNRPPSPNSDPGASGRYNGGSGWILRNNDLSDAHGGIVSLKDSDSPPHQILNNRILRGGKIGINRVNDGTLIKGNKISENNTEDFCYIGIKNPTTGVPSCQTKDGPKPLSESLVESGGMRLSDDATTVDSNEVSHNTGNGIKFDGFATNGTVSNNRVHHNGRTGIGYEISEGGEIFGNAVWENGWKACTDAPGSGISPGSGIGVQSSFDTQVYSNTLAWNAEGIAVVSADREGTEYDVVHDVSVRGNTVAGENLSGDRNHVALGWHQAGGSTLYQSANNNRGANNKYWYTTAEGTQQRFKWSSALKLLSQFNATLGEEGGSYLSTTQKNTALSGKGIPTTPPVLAANRPVTPSCPR